MISSGKEFKRQVDNARRGVQETIEQKWDGLKKQFSSKEDKVSGKQSGEWGDDPSKIIESVESRLKEGLRSQILVGPARRLSGEAEGLLRELQTEDSEKFKKFVGLARDTSRYKQHVRKLEGEAEELERGIREGGKRRVQNDEKSVEELKIDVRNLKSLRKLKLEQRELRKRKQDIQTRQKTIQKIQTDLSKVEISPGTGGGDTVDEQGALKIMRNFDWRSSSPAEKKKELEQQIDARKKFLKGKFDKREARLQEIDEFLPRQT